ncbi:MAG: hypothetical protein ACFE0P_02470 [Oceanicaulis sp.]
MATEIDTARGAAPRGRLGRFSPPDWVFMPGAALVFAGLVVLALAYEPAGEDPLATETEYVMAGPALAQLIAGPGTGFQLLTATGTPMARLTASASFEAAGSLSAGVFTVLPPEFEARLAGRLVKVEATLRAAPEAGGLDETRMAYFTTGEGGGSSGWRTLPVTDTFETVGFCHTVSASAAGEDPELVGLWPDGNGANRGLLLQALRVTIQPEGVTPEACERGA